MSELFNRFQSLRFLSDITFLENLESIIFILLGILLLFFGLKAFRFFLGIVGLGLGVSLANYINDLFIHMKGINLLIFMILVGIAFLFILQTAYKASFFLAGASLAYYFSAGILHFLEAQFLLPVNDATLFYKLAVALIMGILAAYFRDYSVIIGSSFLGSLILTDVCLHLIFKDNSFSLVLIQTQNLKVSVFMLSYVLIILLTILGIFIQTQKKRKYHR